MSDEDSGQPETHKAKLSYTLEERKLLLTLVNKHYEVLNNKKLDMKSAALKNRAWKTINNEFLKHKEVVRTVRTPQQLKRCWENIKSKAKRGDRVSKKLLRWGENRYLLWKDKDADLNDGSDHDWEDQTDLEEDDSDSSIAVKQDLIGNDVSGENDGEAESTLKQLTDLVSSNSCQHCQCEKIEKTARVELLVLEKRRSDLLHKLKVQNLRAKSKREKHLHSLAVQELTLKVANEKRKSDILEKEFSQYS